jgi:RimJ/RimL family protein N-acetyltransferase
VDPIIWDSRALGIDCFELTEASNEVLRQATSRPGHYAVKVHPLAAKEALHRNGFYYCDTLLQPYCSSQDFVCFGDPKASIQTAPDINRLIPICRGAFRHGRFHRDFKVEEARADDRYVNWLRQLHTDNAVLGLKYDDELTGFIACVGNRLVLHALGERWRGKGLAKYFWSTVCSDLFSKGAPEISSSISAANLPALNLYARLGFRFRSPVDVYHRLVV